MNRRAWVKQVRTRAADLCAVMATHWSGGYVDPDPMRYEDKEVAELARKALFAQRAEANGLMFAWAEAEAMIRTGWKP